MMPVGLMQLTAELVRQGFPAPVGVGVRRAAELRNGTAPTLYPVEEAGLGPRAVPERRMLYALGRAAARDALGELGLERCAIPRAADGAPEWPGGIVGAVSHTREAALAVAGRREDYAGLGLDLELLDRGIREDIARLVCRPAEMDWVRGAHGIDRLLSLFSAKEAIFKALYPIERVWLGFSDAELTWEAERGLFSARVLKSVGRGYLEGLRLEVRCVLGPDWVLSTTYLRSPTSE